MLRFRRINMTPIKLLVVLAAVYDGTLFIVRPPDCDSASILFVRASNNTTWHHLKSDSLTGIRVFKVPIQNFTKSDFLTFKIKFHYPTYAMDSNWQNIWLRTKKSDVSSTQIDVNPCCVFTIVFGVLLLAILLMCTITYFVVYWKHY